MKITRILFSKILAKAAVQRSEKEVVVKAPWGNIAALSWGDPSNPPVILCHGRLDACSSFRPLVTLLPDTYFYVSVDLPGNGRSDHLPTGLRYSVMDLVPAISRVQEHFKMDQFAFIGHSQGVTVGKYFNFAYPDRITRFVELSPVPAYFTWELKDMDKWYKHYYGKYYSEDYHKLKGGKETAPRYTYEMIREKMMKARNLSAEAIEHVLERSVEPAGDGLYRITYDPRMKTVMVPPFTSEHLKLVYTSPKTPILCFLAKEEVDIGLYASVPFITDEKAWPNGNFKFKIIEGGHDAHVGNPEYMAEDIKSFLQE